MKALDTCLIAQEAQKHPDRIAILSDDAELSYHDLSKLIQNYQQNLKESGFERGDTLVILEGASIESISLIFACINEGLVACPLNPKWPSHKLNNSLKQLKPKSIWNPKELIITQESNILNLNNFSKDCSTHDSHISPSQISSCIATSGSTGQEKFCLHRYSQHIASAKQSNEVIPLTANDRWLLKLPIHHVSGLAILFRVALAGASIVLSQKSIPDAIHHFSITHCSLVLPQLEALLGDDYTHKKTLKHILLGGSFFPEKTLEKAYTQKLPIHYGYGLSEMGSHIACTQNKTDKGVGRSHPSIEIKINEFKQLLCKGPSLFAGYLINGQFKTPFDEEGWFNTRDLAEIVDGMLIIKGRLDSQFVSGGENIFPEEIESHLLSHPEVNVAIVRPRKDDHFGHVAVAFIECSSPLNDSLKEKLNSYLHERLPNYKCPKDYLPWPNDLEPSKAARPKLIP